MGLKSTGFNYSNPISANRPGDRNSAAHAQPRSGGQNFLSALKQAQSKTGVTFSKHAEQRINSWDPFRKDEYLEELHDAMDLAQSKGARSTLVLMKGVAFLVAPQTRTVITVVPEDRMKENVFTSIDSAVLMNQ